MSAIKKILAVLLVSCMAIAVFGCSSEKESTESESGAETSAAAETESEAEDDTAAGEESEAESESEAEEEKPEDATVQAEVPVETEDISESCGDTINRYFTAIINQNYEGYKAELDPYYFGVYNSWLDGTYGYGMETAMESMHQNLMDAAVNANNGEEVKNVVITKITARPYTADENDENSMSVEEYMDVYNTTLGADFAGELRKQCDDIIGVDFTMTADCDGKELVILDGMQLLMTVTGDEYKIIG